ncbi:hypothetical protein ABEB36_007781 [Hypothenemus hampei]|uniref:Uncharacterized protein n=1 Tax=Hypothenemus hampei TaxID=57062 RepID=A0ABD1EV42_HYPHA
MTMFRRKDILRRHMKNTHPGKQDEIIKTSVKVSDIPKKSVVIDNPNAVNVITASPAITKCPPEPSSTDQSSSCLKRQLLRDITILREAATSYHMLNLRRIYH